MGVAGSWTGAWLQYHDPESATLRNKSRIRRKGIGKMVSRYSHLEGMLIFIYITSLYYMKASSFVYKRNLLI